jgi:cytoplasmic tRNA 2-thiolation protein 2
VVLLSVLDQQLQRQRENSRRLTAYDLHVVLVDMSSTDVHGPTERHLVSLKDRFPEHQYSTLSLEDIFSYDRDIVNSISDGYSHPQHPRDSDGDRVKLKALLSSFTSLTARRDVEDLLLKKLIIAFGKTEGCESILWGDSDSRLASKVLANVAKGRGSSVLWQVCDGPSPYGISFNFPLRDLSKPELIQYLILAPSDLRALIVPLPEQAPSQTKSINDLMDQYIETQGGKYPSIMANVVRTVNKLQRPVAQFEINGCHLCGDPINATGGIEMGRSALCYGCSRLKLEFSDVSGIPTPP